MSFLGSETSVGMPPSNPGVNLARANCPGCGRHIETSGAGATRCAFCGWRGDIFLFNPLPVTVEHSEQALAEDATCMHHPTKKAVAVCAGTGDYICALCSVDLNGQTFSAAYLNAGGKDKASKAFARHLDRPDNLIISMMIACFIPYVNFIFIPAAIFWIPYAVYLYIKALRMRRTDPLFARLMGMGRVIVIPILLTLFGLGWAFGFIAIVVALMSAATLDTP
jgi:hypothetical protein